MSDTTDIGDRVEIAGLRVARVLFEFVTNEALPGSGVPPADFWGGLAKIIGILAPRNAQLLAHRAELQARIDDWHRVHRGPAFDPLQYRRFLEDIGYLEPEGDDFVIENAGVDPEVAQIAGPQLIVPVMNARYAINAANARWGSLYDALYGTDALGEPAPPGPYDPARGARVIAWVRQFLDDVVPLNDGSHARASSYRVERNLLAVELDDGRITGLGSPAAFVGYLGTRNAPRSVLLRNHGLHIELIIDHEHPVGRYDRAGVADVTLESAVTTVMDCEDAVAAVDAGDKVRVYRNWLGLMRGDLTAAVAKRDQVIDRRLADDRRFVAPSGSTLELPGRALMFVRNVGHLMTSDSVLDRAGRPVPEGLLDALVTVLCAVHDLRRCDGRRRNSPAGSIYVVKPKMHGPAEVAFADELFTHVEAALGLPKYTVKIGLMDEERRTSLNLKECLRAARNRLAFINTGFLDRTGDEIHTSMEAGPMVRKADMKSEPWFGAYEQRNVAVGLTCGLPGQAQIGKGMWAAPDQMQLMLAEKIAQPMAGATCAWVPSPSAATLHATHYHRVDVAARQKALTTRPVAPFDDLLTLPVADQSTWDEEQIRAEVENNVQGILGYAVRWVDQGIGCSKVPDIHDVGLMEDRATCRISSQHVANWLLHGIVTEAEVDESLRRMARVVDEQNADDPAYRPMAPSFDGPAFVAARDLIFRGTDTPSGYTEPILHARRLEHKRARVGAAT